MISERFGLVWRKVGRREPRKAARAARAASTWVAPHREIPGLDRVLPPGVVDHECRPYELGWLLYAWLPARTRMPDQRDEALWVAYVPGLKTTASRVGIPHGRLRVLFGMPIAALTLREVIDLAAVAITAAPGC